MVSRREVLTGGIVGGLAAAPAAVEEQQADRDGQRAIERAIQSARDSIARTLEGPSLAHGPVPKLRQFMEFHLKAHNKFPDYIDIGVGIFYDMYDWHVRHQQQLVVTRQSDGRYTMQFMFTMLMLRHDVEVNFIGVPYDKG